MQAFSEGSVTNERLRYVLNMHRADITLLLKGMCANGLLESEGSGRGTKYHIPISNAESNVGSNVGSNVRKKRLSRDEIREEIVSLCEDWVSL